MATSDAGPASSDKRSRTNTRARLLAAARTTFTAKGYGATSVGDICTAAGFTRGAFYRNFDSRAEFSGALGDEQPAPIAPAAAPRGEGAAAAPEPLAAA